MIEFFVPMQPQPQGSSSAYKRGEHIVVTSANKKLKPFRAAVTRCAKVALFRAGYDGDDGPRSPMFAREMPVKITLAFTFERPKSAKKRVHHTVTPDCDKLVRAIGDALTDAGVWADDSQVVEISARKEYGEVARVRVKVEGIA